MRTHVIVPSVLMMVLGLASGAVPAQAAAWSPRLGLEVGTGLTHGPSVALIDEDEHWGLGASGGVVAEWSLGPRLALVSGPRWERLSGKTSGALDFFATGVPGGTRMAYTQRLGFDRVALPVRLALRPAGAGWSIEGGLVAGWLAHVRRSADVTITELPALARSARPAAMIFEEVGTFDATDWTHRFHRWDLAATGGLGWDRPLGAQTLRVRARWQQGLVDIGKFDEPVRLGSAELTLGLLW
jgi:hypothetical protein